MLRNPCANGIQIKNALIIQLVETLNKNIDSRGNGTVSRAFHSGAKGPWSSSRFSSLCSKFVKKCEF